MTIIRTFVTALAVLALAACSAPALRTSASPPETAQDRFFAALTSHCGKAYGGALASSEAADADMAGRPMVMHVRECSDTRIAIPFHIQNADGSWDRSRTWLITRTNDAEGPGLRLKHDHRHADGTPDAVTMYGGDTEDAGSAREQDFPVDAESIALFRANGLTASVTNVWRVEIDPAGPDARFAYQLSRSNRLFRVEFDLSQPLDSISVR